MAFRIPTDQPTRRRSPRKEEPDHLAFIRSLPCVICLAPSEAAHVSFSDARYATMRARGMKNDDCFVLPLCRVHHANSHAMNEQRFWSQYEIDPYAFALSLHRVSGDLQAGERIVNAWRNWINR